MGGWEGVVARRGGGSLRIGLDSLMIWTGSVSIIVFNLCARFVSCRVRTSECFAPARPSNTTTKTALIASVLPLLLFTQAIAALPSSLSDCRSDMGILSNVSPVMVTPPPSSLVRRRRALFSETRNRGG
jgi:hypothetical protein